MPHKDKKARREYARKWAAKNRAKLQASAKVRRSANRKKRNAAARADYAKNREKIRAYQRAWHAANKEKVRKWRRRYYVANKERLLAANRAAYKKYADAGRRYQNGVPAATRKPPNACECCGKKHATRRLALDHCHASGKFRGWLCGKCNAGLGLLGDTVAGLKLAIAYLEKNA